jgi:asparagine synthase (glutamine-hydrolysing)
LFGGYPSFRDVPRLVRGLRRLRRLPRAARRTLAGLLALRRPLSVRHKLADMFASSGQLVSLYLHRRRVLSDRQLAQLGIEPDVLDLTADFIPPEALPDGPGLEDPVRAIAELESRFYQANVLLRDADTNGMAHGLEIRVPFLDRRVLDLAHALPGPVRLPPRAPGKHLLRQAFAPLLRPALQRQSKRGFTLPIRRWMLGSLRPLCELALSTLKDVGLLRPEGVDEVWRGFLAEPESQLWTRAFTLCVLGTFIANTRATV